MADSENHSRLRCDVAIIGAGPAGMMLALALAEQNVSVCVVGPEDTWDKTLCAWRHEAEGSLLKEFVGRSFPALNVVTDIEASRCALPAYVSIDTEGLRRRADAALPHRARHTARALAVEHSEGGSQVFLDDARTLDASLVVDASGGSNPWVERSGPAPTAFQTAYGMTIDVTEVGLLVPALMDLRSTAPSDESPASFLYALPLGEQRWFVEETVLVSRPILDLRTLKRRLETRLAQYGVAYREVGTEERCRIPMDIALPVVGQRVLPFGAAAGYIHPATGYQLAYTASQVEPFAAVIASHVASDNLGRPAATSELWKTLWPPAARRNHSLYRFGGEVLIGLDASQTRAFFNAFFSAPADLWMGYLSRTLDTLHIARLMWCVHRALPKQTQRHISTQARRQLGPLLGQLLSPATSPPIPAYAVSPTSA